MRHFQLDLTDPELAAALRAVKRVMLRQQRKAHGRRTGAAMKQHQAQGRRMSSKPPYGWRIARSGPRNPDSGLPVRLVRDAGEQSLIRRIVALRSQGLSTRAIAQHFNAEEVTCRGGKWQHGLVAKLLRRHGDPKLLEANR